MSDAIDSTVLLGWDDDAQRLFNLVLATPADELERPVAGEWSPRQILTHLLDTEIVYGQRMRTALAQPGSPILPFDQDAWVAGLPYQNIPIEVIGAAFVALRKLNTALLLDLPESAWDQTVLHPDRGPQKLSDFVLIFGKHIPDHLKELESSSGRRA